MTYELAKQLKDAGFTNAKLWYADDATPTDKFPYPDLGELIEACGDGFLMLKKNFKTSKWEAYSTKIDETREDLTTMREEFTPEEAVARLWLALNKESEV